MSTTARKEKRLRRLVAKTKKTCNSLEIPSGYTREGNLRVDGSVPLVAIRAHTLEEGRLLLEERGYTNAVVRYHGTKKDRFRRIALEGLKPSTGGMLGPGVYFGGKAKARVFASHDGVLLECLVDLGRTWIPSVKCRGHDERFPEGYDTLYASEKLRNEEWCVRNPKRIIILRAFYLLGETKTYKWYVPVTPRSMRADGTPLGPGPEAQKLLSVAPRTRMGNLITTPPTPPKPLKPEKRT